MATLRAVLNGQVSGRHFRAGQTITVPDAETGPYLAAYRQIGDRIVHLFETAPAEPAPVAPPAAKPAAQAAPAPKPAAAEKPAAPAPASDTSVPGAAPAAPSSDHPAPAPPAAHQ